MSTNGLPLASAREVHNLFRSRGQHQDVPIEGEENRSSHPPFR